MPYRTHENLIDGLVMTFVDIDRLKRAQRSAKQLRLYTDEIIDGIRTGVLVVDVEQRVVMVNHAFCAMFGIVGSNPIGQRLDVLTNVSDSLPQLESFCTRLLSDDSEAEQSLPSLRLDTPGYENAVVSVTGRRLPDHPDQPSQVLMMFDQLEQ
jgi:two-component system CheB/CheR fusion protein